MQCLVRVGIIIIECFSFYICFWWSFFSRWRDGSFHAGNTVDPDHALHFVASDLDLLCFSGNLNWNWLDCFLVGNRVDPDQTLHCAASGWGLLTVFNGSFSGDESFSAGNGVDPSRRGIVRCLIRVCIPQVPFRIIELFSASGGLIALASHLVKCTLSKLEALIGCRIV